MITFHNPGEIDPRLITTLGVNVKESSNPFGFFGTGLKYAIAVLLREGQDLEIWSGQRHFSFVSNSEVIRGKEFGFISMIESESPSIPLGFTTELGKNWSLANAYRELYCNAKDEGGDVKEGWREPQAGFTTIVVRGDAFSKAYSARDTFLLLPSRGAPIFSTSEIEVYPGQSEQVFYRGVAVYKTPTRANFTINIKSEMQLTEDRTLAYGYFANCIIARAFATTCSDPRVLREIILTDCFERNQLDDASEWSDTLLDVLESLIAADPISVPEKLRNKYYHKRKKDTPRQEIVGDPMIERALQAAVTLLERASFPISKFPIKVCEDLGKNVLGLTDFHARMILLSRKTFVDAALEETLLEEFIHLEYGVADNTREIQDVLLRHLVRLAGKTGSRAQDIGGSFVGSIYPFEKFEVPPPLSSVKEEWNF